jgi:hypothetical protein
MKKRMPDFYFKKSGQGTIEYILLTVLVVGIVLTIFNVPLRRFLASYQSRKGQYTQVVSQGRLGIPLAWFGGSYANLGNGTGGTTAGANTNAGDNSGQNTAGDTAGDPGTINNPNVQGPTTGGGATNGGDNAGGDNAGGDTSGPSGYQGAGGANGGNGTSGNSLFGSGSNNNGRNGPSGRRGGSNSGNDDSDEEGGDSGGTSTGGRRTVVNARGDASTQDKDGKNSKESGQEEEDEKTSKLKKPEDSGALGKEKSLFGSTRERLRQGSCENIDMKVIFQIAFVLGLLFLLASMLFQKRGDD